MDHKKLGAYESHKAPIKLQWFMYPSDYTDTDLALHSSKSAVFKMRWYRLSWGNTSSPSFTLLACFVDILSRGQRYESLVVHANSAFINFVSMLM